VIVPICVAVTREEVVHPAVATTALREGTREADHPQLTVMTVEEESTLLEDLPQDVESRHLAKTRAVTTPDRGPLFADRPTTVDQDQELLPVSTDGFGIVSKELIKTSE
jgi:hypothetical protein